MSLASVRQRIAEEVLDQVISKKGNLLVSTFVSSGKTCTTLKTLYENHNGINFGYFAPYHKVIEENVEFSKFVDYDDVIHLRGRNKLCLSKNLKEYAKMGVNIRPFCDNYCTLKHTECPYYKQLRILKKELTCFTGVHAHIPTLLQELLFEKVAGDRMFFNHYDVIIIDEFPYSTIYNQIQASIQDINTARDILEMTGMQTNEYYAIRSLLDQLSLSTKSIGINYEKISNLMDIKGLDFKQFVDEYDYQLLRLVDEEGINPPKEIVYNISQIFAQKPNLEQLKWMLYRTAKTQWHDSYYFLTISYVDKFLNIPNKIIALDGTADIETWRSLIGKNTSSIKYDLVYKNTYQLVGARNPVSTIIDKGKFSIQGLRLMKIVKELCESRETDILICANMRVQKLIHKYLKNAGIMNYQFATYYNLRSRNSYFENSDVCVVFHEPNIPPFQAQILENVCGIDGKIVRKIHTEDEMKQAIGRIRISIPYTPEGRIREKIEVFVLSSSNKGKLVEEAEYMDYHDMLGYVRGEKKRLYYRRLARNIKKFVPCTKEELREKLKISRNKLTNILKNLEELGVIKVSWGKIEWLKDLSEKDEIKFVLRVD